MENRVGRLEVEARAWRIGCVVALVLLIFSLRQGAQAAGGIRGPVRVESQAFVLKDDAGRVRAKLALDRTRGEAPVLYFFDRADHGRLVMTLDDDGRPKVALNDAVGKPRVTLTLKEDGEPSMVFVTRDTIYEVPR